MSRFALNFSRARLWGSLALAGALLVTACNDEDTPDENNEPNVEGHADCDPINEGYCALPWPSNLYLKEDASRVTGHTLNLGETTLPPGRSAVAPEAWNNLDGYGVSSPILFHFPSLDLSGLPSEDDMSGSWGGEPGDAMLLRVEDSGALTRIPFWVERDLRDSEAKAVTYIRPAIILEEGVRYIVALRNLKHLDGTDVERSPAFDKLVRNAAAGDPLLEDRQARFNRVFDELETIGIEREELTLAWDFNTMSDESLHGPMLRMRELALAALDGGGPEMRIEAMTAYQNADSTAAAYDATIAFDITGTFVSPWFMKSAGQGHLFNTDAEGVIQQNGTIERPFWIRVPYTAVGGDAVPAGLMQYGHGLLGQGSQVRGRFNNRVADEYNYIHFASDWTGMSDSDLVAITTLLGSFGNFRWLSDNMHQGIIEFMVLAKGMIHTFPELDEVLDAEIQVDTDKIFYNGISQGGIYGATYVAVSPDIDVGHLGVPGSNYSMLLQRSVDFDLFEGIFQISTPAPSSRAILLAAAQTLWDMTDPASYYRHLEVDPFPGNNPKHVLLVPAKGDFQVSPLTNVIAANSLLGIAVMEGWGQDITHMGLNETPYTSNGQPYKGSGVVIYDLGNAWPPLGNITPIIDGTGVDANGLGDPHGIPRYFPAHQEQMMHFLETGGEIIDVCGGNGCNFSQAPCGSTPHLDARECWVDD